MNDVYRLIVSALSLSLLCCGAPTQSSGEPGEAGGTSISPLKPLETQPQRQMAEALESLPDGEFLLTVDRAFECDASLVGEGAVMAELLDGAGTIGIRSASPADCTFNLVFSDSSGAERILSTEPGGFILGGGRELSGGDTVVCANNLHTSAEGSDASRRIDAVTIDCAVRRNGAWSPLSPVVVPDGPWAPWLRDVVETESGLVLRYTRDFSFQFLNMSDNGRPPEDGIYETALSTVGPEVRSGVTRKIADKTNPLANGTSLAWEPTEADKAELGDLIDFSAPEDP